MNVWKDELPPPFACVICERVVEPSPWHWQRDHKPPVCGYCSNSHGHQVRIPGMTRGDHHQLQRLTALIGAMGVNVTRRRYGY